MSQEWAFNHISHTGYVVNVYGIIVLEIFHVEAFYYHVQYLGCINQWYVTLIPLEHGVGDVPDVG